MIEVSTWNARHDLRGAASALHEWIAGGHTQDPGGAYCGWASGADGTLSEPYPEITGYFLTYWSWALDQFDAQTTDNHRRAADWLAERFSRGDYAGRPRRDGATVYYFDVAMAAHGLLQWGAANDSARHIDVGLDAVALIESAWQGRAPHCVDEEAADVATRSKWSLSGTTHLWKVVQALLSAEVHGRASAGDLADRIIVGAFEALGASDAVPIRTSPGGPISMHAVCYGAEGLWVWGKRRGDSRAIDASRSLTEWLTNRSDTDGSVPGFVDPSDTGERTLCQGDVLAQVSRLNRLHGIDNGRAVPLLEELERTVRNDETGAWMPYMPGLEHEDKNTWATMFAAQALAFGEAGAAPRWDQLV
ncbi:hypothetical protein ACWESM_09800 [Nocardia sp. NPDC003999]